jgi:hypothetical protein
VCATFKGSSKRNNTKQKIKFSLDVLFLLMLIEVTLQGKGKGHPINCNEDTEREKKYSSIFS